jgi:hypothetical protein
MHTVKNTKGDEVHVTTKKGNVRIEIRRYDGRVLTSVEMKPLDAAYLSDRIQAVCIDLQDGTR